jgi:2-desacetyl-2-hydroxyethyl bacteriochlorophyllide A dehydrogenase
VKAGVWEDAGVIRCRERAKPEPAAEELLVEVAYCGFCGTDSHIIDGSYEVGPPPQVIGHEVSGVVSAAGPGADPSLVGQAVACNPVGCCGTCAWCRDGLPTHCRNKSFSASGFAEFAVYRPQQLFPVPEGLSLLDAAFLEPAATALRAVESARMRAGENVLVIGGGSLGLLVASVARLCGAGSVTVSEPRKRNRDLALQRGADAAVDPSVEDLRQIASAVGERRGFDVVFEVAAVAEALELAPSLARRGGRVVVLGVFDAERTVPFRPAALTEREISIAGSYGGGNCFDRAVELLGALDPSMLVTTVEPLERIADVYPAVAAGRQIKAMLRP